MRYDILEPGTDPNISLEKLTQVFAPLYTECWIKEKSAALRGLPFDMNVGGFVNLWMSKALRVFIAYDGDTPCGYLTGMLFRPLTHNVIVFQVEDWYMKDGWSCRDLFDYVYSVVKFMGVDEIQVRHSPEEYYTPPSDVWKSVGETYTTAFVKA